uniref:Uncharacterized protein n=1 Tax=Rangifer tarandus platyrhynchus TaxID=3082113 RepID=A0ACB0F102_RANTA|nr:unnamed protein product [Rangifer tarandus platyrhynchus]
MVTKGLGPPRSSPDGRAPSPPPRRSGRTRVPRPFGRQSWGAPLRAPTPGRLPRLLTHRPRARGSQGRPLPPCGRSPRGPGPHTPLQTGRGLRAGRAVEPGRLGLGRGSRARRETPGASHEAFPAKRLPDAGSVGSPALAPGLELAASASEPWNQAESGEALPFQLQPESRPPRRGGVTGARGGHRGQRIGAAAAGRAALELRGPAARATPVTLMRYAPQTLSFPFCLPCVPSTPKAGAVAEAECWQGGDAAE